MDLFFLYGYSETSVLEELFLGHVINKLKNSYFLQKSRLSAFLFLLFGEILVLYQV